MPCYLLDDGWSASVQGRDSAMCPGHEQGRRSSGPVNCSRRCSRRTCSSACRLQPRRHPIGLAPADLAAGMCDVKMTSLQLL
jgi:hypothetical protein